MKLLSFATYFVTLKSGMAIYDPVFNNYDLSHNMLKNTSKLWTLYADKALSVSLSDYNTGSFTFYLRNLLLSFYKYLCKRQHQQFEWMCHHFNSACTGTPLQEYVMEDLSRGIRIHRPPTVCRHDPAGNIHNMRTVRCIFNMDMSLRLNVTFVHFEVTKVLTTCSYGKFKMSPPALEYCGRHGHFILYSKSFRVTLEIEQYLLMFVHVIFQFSIMSTNVVYTAWKGQGFLSQIHLFALSSRVHSTFHVVVNKLDQICLCASDENIQHFVVDGPGYAARVFKVNNIPTCSSSFQVIIQFTSDQTHFGLNVSHWGKELPQMKVRVNDYFWPRTFVFAEDIGSPSVCSIKFLHLKESNLNISLSNLNFSGLSTMDCKYGGIAAFEDRDGFWTTCKEAEHITRRVYSEAALTSLVLYSYPGYSTIAVTILVHTTQCKVVRLDFCQLQHAWNMGMAAKHISTMSFKQMDRDMIKQETSNIWRKLSKQSSFLLNIEQNSIKYSMMINQCYIIQDSDDFIRDPRAVSSGKISCYIELQPEIITQFNRLIVSRFDRYTTRHYQGYNLSRYSLFHKHHKLRILNKTCELKELHQSEEVKKDYNIFTPDGDLDLRAVSWRSSLTDVYVMEWYISYFPVEESTWNNYFETLKPKGFLKRKAIFNDDILALRLKHKGKCFQEKKNNQKVVFRIRVMKNSEYNPWNVFLTEKSPLWNLRIILTCEEPTHYISLAGFMEVRLYNMRGRFTQQNTVVEAFWPRALAQHKLKFQGRSCTKEDCQLLYSHFTLRYNYKASSLLPRPFHDGAELPETFLLLKIKSWDDIMSGTYLKTGKHDEKLFNSFYPNLPRGAFKKYKKVLLKDQTSFYSWNTARNFCMKHRADFPVFRNREELKNFLYFLKTSEPPSIEAIYIGLKLDKKTKVKKDLLSLQTPKQKQHNRPSANFLFLVCRFKDGQVLNLLAFKCG